MKFCILIELSKDNISFLYNRSDSDNGFVPFVEQGLLPLAIYCSGNQMEIGQFAVDEANKHNPNAYVNVFKKLRDGGTFKYRGEEIPNNMLLFNAIQRYLSSFFDSTLIGQMGRLEQNIATMPICFIFNADIDENERLFVKESFVRSGYANVGVRDCDQLAMQTVCSNSDYSVCVTSNGYDLFVNFYNKQGKRIDATIIRNSGRDPRMNHAVEILWNSIGFDNYYLNKEDERAILEQVAENFLGSGKYSFNERVTFSSGYSYDVSLSLHELEQYATKDDGRTIVDIMRKLADNGINPSNCTVILLGKAAHNSYFSNMFKKEFNIVKSIDSAIRTEILASFLKQVKSSDYQFVDKIIIPSDSHIGVNFPSPCVSKPENNSPNRKPTEKSILPTKLDERDMKILRLNVETCLHNNKMDQAYNDIIEFRSRMHAKKIHAFDEELELLLRKIKVSKDGNNATVTSKPTMTPTPPSKLDERDMKILRMEVATCVNNGNRVKIKTIINAFRERMNAKNVHAFDEELNELLEAKGNAKDIKSATSNHKRTPSSSVCETNELTKTQIDKTVRRSFAAQSCDEGTDLMRKEKFKEAREWFRSNKQSSKADDCTTIIRWLRFLPAYEAELQTTIATKNKEKARSRIKEIKEIICLYNKYGVDVSRLTKLADEYKRIK